MRHLKAYKENSERIKKNPKKETRKRELVISSGENCIL